MTKLNLKRIKDLYHRERAGPQSRLSAGNYIPTLIEEVERLREEVETSQAKLAEIASKYVKLRDSIDFYYNSDAMLEVDWDIK